MTDYYSEKVTGAANQNIEITLGVKPLSVNQQCRSKYNFPYEAIHSARGGAKTSASLQLPLC